MSLSRKELDQMGCDMPDCGHDHSVLYVHSACHPKAGTTVRYIKADGLLLFDCQRCHKPVCAIAVAAVLPPELATLGDAVQ